MNNKKILQKLVNLQNTILQEEMSSVGFDTHFKALSYLRTEYYFHIQPYEDVKNEYLTHIQFLEKMLTEKNVSRVQYENLLKRVKVSYVNIKFYDKENELYNECKKMLTRCKIYHKDNKKPLSNSKRRLITELEKKIVPNQSMEK